MKNVMNYIFFVLLIGMPALDAMHSMPANKNPRYLFLPVMYLLPLPQSIRQGNYEEVATFLRQWENQYKQQGNQVKNNIFLAFYLHFAVKCGNRNIALLLIQKGANVNTENFFSQTPLHIAAIHDHKDIASLLIEKGADVNAKDYFGKKPMYYALQHASQQDRENAKLLLLNRTNGVRRNGILKGRARWNEEKNSAHNGGDRW